MDQPHVAAPVEFHDDLVAQREQHVLVYRVEADTSADAAVTQLHLDIDRLDELQLQQPGDEQLGHLDTRLEILECPDDALQIAGRFSLIREQGLAVFGSDAGVIQVDRHVRALSEEGSALQHQGPIELRILPLVEEQILALVKSEHGATVELARLRVFREENGIVDAAVVQTP